ncbi:hypothetical protein NEPAR07_2165 [Nematocida parisii]|nr:hypothetical protein NEPAR07_2165 [Nematocida parisii]
MEKVISSNDITATNTIAEDQNVVAELSEPTENPSSGEPQEEAQPSDPSSALVLETTEPTNDEKPAPEQETTGDSENAPRERKSIFRKLYGGIKRIPANAARHGSSIKNKTIHLLRVVTCSAEASEITVDAPMDAPVEAPIGPPRNLTVVENAILQTQLCLEEMDRQLQEVEPPVHRQIDTSLLLDSFELISKIQKIISSSNPKTSDLSLPMVIVHSMRESSLDLSNSLFNAEEKLYSSLMSGKKPNTLISGRIVKYLISKAYEPSTYLKYWLAKNSDFEKAYTELYQSTLASLTTDVEDCLRSEFPVMFFTEVIHEIKAQLVKKLSAVKLQKAEHNELEVLFVSPSISSGLETTKEIDTYLQKNISLEDPQEVNASQISDVADTEVAAEPSANPSEEPAANLSDSKPIVFESTKKVKSALKNPNKIEKSVKKRVTFSDKIKSEHPSDQDTPSAECTPVNPAIELLVPEASKSNI